MEPAIDRSQKVGTVSPESDKMSSIKIIHQSTNLIEQNDLINSVEVAVKNNPDVENQNDIVEIQTPDLDPLIV